MEFSLWDAESIHTQITHSVPSLQKKAAADAQANIMHAQKKIFGQHVVLINKREGLHSARPGRHRWLEKLGMWCMYMHKPISIQTNAHVYIYIMMAYKCPISTLRVWTEKNKLRTFGVEIFGVEFWSA